MIATPGNRTARLVDLLADAFAAFLLVGAVVLSFAAALRRRRGPPHRGDGFDVRSEGPVPQGYEAEGTLHLGPTCAFLEDDTGMRWPLAVLLRELSGRRVRILVEPRPQGERP